VVVDPAPERIPEEERDGIKQEDDGRPVRSVRPWEPDDTSKGRRPRWYAPPMAEVRTDRPVMPDGYGVPETASGLLAWSTVEAKLRAATEFWLASTRPDGRPHVVPRWGVWFDGAFFYDGSPMTRHARNLAENPSCALHLESGADVVILEGGSQPSAPIDTDLGGRLSAEYGRKYGARGYAPAADSWSDEHAGGMRIFVPRTGLAWSEFPADVTRFHFAAG
jgi:hypothetical protein